MSKKLPNERIALGIDTIARIRQITLAGAGPRNFRPTRRAPTFCILEGPRDPEQEYFCCPEDRRAVFVGRDRDCCDWWIDDPSVSRRHCRLFVHDTPAGPGLRLQDLGSTNGTFVNGDRVTEVDLRSGDKVHFADVLVRYELLEQADLDFIRSLQERAREAQRDTLMGLRTKSFLGDGLPQLVTDCERLGVPLTVVVASIDRLEEIGCRFGTAVVDSIKSTVASVFSGAVRAMEPVACIEDNLFAIVLVHTVLVEGYYLAERIRRDVQDIDLDSDVPGLRVSISLGVAQRDGPEPADSLIQRAHLAMRMARVQGRNRTVVDDRDSPSTQSNRELESIGDAADSVRMHDIRQTDVLCRYHLPFPIAALYRQRYTTHDPADKLMYTLRFVEGALRFLALVNLTDALSGEPPREKVQEWVGSLSRPSMGGLNALGTDLAQYIVERGKPFLHEIEQLLEPEWLAAALEFVVTRNRIAHDDGFVVSAKKAERLLAELGDSFGCFVKGLLFLQHYKFGAFHAPDDRGETIRVHWYPSQGLEEYGDPLEVDSTERVVNGVPVLVDALRKEALFLDPMIQLSYVEGVDDDRLVWLLDYRGNRPSKFAHPSISRYELRQGIQLPPGASGRGPRRTCLHLDDVSWHKMQGGGEAADFGENYRLLGRIGRGGMGEVWEAENVPLNRRCALKVLHEWLVRAPAARNRFLREGKLLADIEHPSVVKVYGCGFNSGRVPFLELEFVDGEDLNSRLRREGPFELVEATTLMLHVLDALQVIHDQGVIHRDVKPSNFMLSRGRLRMIDFGIASQENATRLTETAAQMGTLGYMAPEQFKPKSTPTVEMDVYGAGCLLLALLTGRDPEPYHSMNLMEALSGLPAEVAAVVRTALSVQPDSRFHAVSEMRSALVDAVPDLGDPDGTAGLMLGVTLLED